MPCRQEQERQGHGRQEDHLAVNHARRNIVIIGIVCVALVGSGAYWFYQQHFETRFVPVESAAQEFQS
jgi:hypothetical protein